MGHKRQYATQTLSVSSLVLLDSPVVGADMEEDGSPAGLSGGTIISRIHLALTLSVILIKIVLIINVMLNKAVFILSKVLGILNKVLMWHKVGVM